jgi:hypothetical protein
VGLGIRPLIVRTPLLALVGLLIASCNASPGSSTDPSSQPPGSTVASSAQPSTTPRSQSTSSTVAGGPGPNVDRSAAVCNRVTTQDISNAYSGSWVLQTPTVTTSPGMIPENANGSLNTLTPPVTATSEVQCIWKDSSTTDLDQPTLIYDIDVYSRTFTFDDFEKSGSGNAHYGVQVPGVGDWAYYIGDTSSTDGTIATGSRNVVLYAFFYNLMNNGLPISIGAMSTLAQTILGG